MDAPLMPLFWTIYCPAVSAPIPFSSAQTIVVFSIGPDQWNPSTKRIRKKGWTNCIGAVVRSPEKIGILWKDWIPNLWLWRIMIWNDNAIHLKQSSGWKHSGCRNTFSGTGHKSMSRMWIVNVHLSKCNSCKITWMEPRTLTGPWLFENIKFILSFWNCSFLKVWLYRQPFIRSLWDFRSALGKAQRRLSQVVGMVLLPATCPFLMVNNAFWNTLAALALKMMHLLHV